MNTRLEWLVRRRVLYAARSGKESISNLEAFTQQVIQLLVNEGQAPVHMIWDMSGLDAVGVDRRKAMVFLNRLMKHESVEWIVVVDPEMPPLRRLLAATMLRLSGIHWRTVDSQTAGLEFLRKVDTSLSPV
jgi:hypothetical protein